MKKVYEKPEIVFESFSLSTSIAGDCEVKTHTPAAMECAYGEDDFGQPIFVEAAQVCVSKVQENDTLCYHVFEANSLFNS